MKKTIIAGFGLALFAYSAIAADGQRALTATKVTLPQNPQKIGSGKCPLCFSKNTAVKIASMKETEKLSDNKAQIIIGAKHSK